MSAQRWSHSLGLWRAYRIERLLLVHNGGQWTEYATVMATMKYTPPPPVTMWWFVSIQYFIQIHWSHDKITSIGAPAVSRFVVRTYLLNNQPEKPLSFRISSWFNPVDFGHLNTILRLTIRLLQCLYQAYFQFSLNSIKILDTIVRNFVFLSKFNTFGWYWHQEVIDGGIIWSYSMTFEWPSLVLIWELIVIIFISFITWLQFKLFITSMKANGLYLLSLSIDA